MAFRKGQKVVCIDDSRHNFDPNEKEIVKGQIYTIRWAGIWGSFFWPNQPCVRLEEIHRGEGFPDVNGIPKKLREEHFDIPFRANRFRPIVEKKTDISIFTAMLKDTKIIERV